MRTALSAALSVAAPRRTSTRRPQLSCLQVEVDDADTGPHGVPAVIIHPSSKSFTAGVTQRHRRQHRPSRLSGTHTPLSVAASHDPYGGIRGPQK